MELRQRKVEASNDESTVKNENDELESNKKTSSSSHSSGSVDLTQSYWLTRILLLRYTCFIYLVAFLVAYKQNKALIGSRGLLPANVFLDSITLTNFAEKLWHVPTLLWFVDYKNNVDFYLDAIALSGIFTSALVIITGSATTVIMLVLWMLYHSLVNVGQRWHSFGWESQLLETGFLVAFLCPFRMVKKFPITLPTPKIFLWAHRWLLFRIMLGAGLIKIRGDECWRNLTCMNYHYETQPVPNPVALFLHAAPQSWHSFEVAANHFVELIAPWLLLVPLRWARISGAIIQIVFQLVLIVSGNLSFLNWLTITPALACFDDQFLSFLSSNSTKAYILRLEIHIKQLTKPSILTRTRSVFNIAVAGLIALLSVSVVRNLLSPHQAMNTSFDPLRLVNTYGAFGSVTKRRNEIIIEGTNSLDPTSKAVEWREYEFNCKPGSVQRRPCIISPYHYRLDWLMWFAAFQDYRHNPWLIHLIGKLLRNDAVATTLIANNPFSGGDPPKFIRARLFRYRFAGPFKSGVWWERTFESDYLSPVNVESLKPIFKQFNWPI